MIPRFEPLPVEAVRRAVGTVGLSCEDGREYVVVRYVVGGDFYEQRLSPDRAFEFAAQLLAAARTIRYRSAES